MDRKKLVKRLIFIILFIFVTNFLANGFYWYYSIWYFDIFMHFLGGFWIGLLCVYLFPTQGSFRLSILKVLLFVFVIGVGWEIFEIVVNDVIAQNPFNSLDTISDIFMDLSGGTFALLYFFKRIMVQSDNGKKS